MKTFFAFFWSLLALVSGSDPVPQYQNVWPLANTTCGFDVKARKDAKYPTLESCFVAVGSQHPNLPYSSLTLDGSSFFDLRMFRELDDEEGFTINVKPFRLGGTILHYTARSCSDCLLEFLVELGARGEVIVTLDDTDGSPATHTMPTVRVSLDRWNYLAFGFHPHDCVVTLTFKTEAGGEMTVKKPFGNDREAHLDKNGNWKVLRVGARKDDTSFFQGEVTCASVASGVLSYPYDSSMAQCAGTWNPPPEAPVLDLPPEYVFLLRDHNAGFDVKHATWMRHGEGGRDLRPDPTTPSALGYHGSLRMDGSVLSTLDLSLPSSLLHSDFALALYVNMAPSTSGVLAHAQIVPSPPSGIGEVVLRVNTTHVTASVTLSGSGATAGHVAVARQSPDVWDVVSVGRRGAELVLGSGRERAGAPVSWDTGSPPSSDHTLLRLGGSYGDQEGFHGNMACLAVFSVGAASAGVLRQSTEAACSGPHSLPAETETPVPTDANYTFKTLRTDAQPIDSLMTGSEGTLGTEFKVRSLADCAKECRLGLHCRSFTVSKVKDARRELGCRLLDFLTRELLQDKPGTNYYVLV